MRFMKRTSRKWRGVDFMALIPARTCEWTEGAASDLVVVLQPRFRSGLLGRHLQPRLGERKKHVRIPLEPRGSFLWLMMDGRLTVGELAAAFAEQFPADMEQVPERVATYLYQMAENHLIEFLNIEIRDD